MLYTNDKNLPWRFTCGRDHFGKQCSSNNVSKRICVKFSQGRKMTWTGGRTEGSVAIDDVLKIAFPRSVIEFICRKCLKYIQMQGCHKRKGRKKERSRWGVRRRD